LDIETLRILADLATTKSFSKTALRSFISQSAVSQRIRTLEAECGHVLVERGKGRPGAQFTEAGEVLLAGAREILARADGIKRELAELAGAVGGALRVATVYSIGLHALTPAISAFLAEFPQVNLHIEYLRTDRIYDALLNGTIDCGIVACPRERPQIEAVPLPAENMVIIVPSGDVLSKQPAAAAAELEGRPFIAFDPDIPTRNLIDDYLRGHGVAVKVVQSFDNIETIKRVVEIGLGISIVPETTVRREVRDQSLCALRLTGEPLIRPTGVLLRRGRARGRVLTHFLTTLVAMGNEQAVSLDTAQTESYTASAR
jgi:DNA-binding transcriptional LysR family regulator